MRRMVWVAIGAAGGVLVYRRAQTMMADARERGVVLSAQQAGLSAVSALATARSVAAAAADRSVTARVDTTPGSAAARVLRTSRQGEK